MWQHCRHVVSMVAHTLSGVVDSPLWLSSALWRWEKFRLQDIKRLITQFTTWPMNDSQVGSKNLNHVRKLAGYFYDPICPSLGTETFCNYFSYVGRIYRLVYEVSQSVWTNFDVYSWGGLFRPEWLRLAIDANRPHHFLPRKAEDSDLGS